MKKTVLLYAFVLALIAFGQTAWAQSYINVTTEAELIAAVQTNGANIQFANPISTTSLLEIKDSKTITIDMNGFTLDRGCTSRGSQVIVVRTGSTLNLSNGILTGGWGGNGGALDIETNTTVNLNDVIISGNKADDRGGGISNNGTLTMQGGSITNNTCHDHDAPRGGGGFFNYSGATATLTNVTINGNRATVTGGGGICNFGTLTINGCTIQNNVANTHGGGIWQEGTLNMQGTNIINDNWKPDGLRSNLYLKNGTVITITGDLTGSNISVGMETLGTFTSGYSTYNDGHPAGFFTADKQSVTGMRLVNGEAQLDNVIPEGGVYYIERSWNETTQRVEATYHIRESNQYTTLTGSDDDTYLDPGWYVVKGSDVVYDDYLYMNGGGEYHLILCDGASIKAMFFIVESPNILHIHGQADNTGKMISTYVYNFVAHKCAGIGGTYDNANGPIFIHGGDIDVHATLSSAGIGGGGYASQGGPITIYGGTVHAEGGYEPGGSAGSGSGGGAGIGGGRNGDGGIVNIYGGSVYATGKGSTSGAAGIGSGSYAHNSGTISIYGGYVEAKGYFGAAGIGGGEGTNGADVTIHGGTVKAEGKTEGPGIGAGKNDNERITYAGTLTVTGGKVYAYGAQRGAGIGGGWNTNGSNVTISGGYVYAEGGKYAAGIGSGCEYITGGERHGGTLTVTGGYVEAHGGEDGAGIGGGEDADGGTVNISGGEVRAYGNANGAGIGGGEDGNGGNVTITGGIVVAQAGGDQRAIGAGVGSTSHGSLTFADNTAVFVTTDLNRSVKANRVIDCRNFSYVRINECSHGGATCSDNGSGISVGCPYCNESTVPYTFNANGNWNDGSKWFAGYMPHEGKDVDVKARATIPNNCIANVGNIALQDGGSLTIADGGQLIHSNAGVTATVQKDITGHGGNNDGGWNFIASPMVTNITPTAINGFLTNNYDLYYYDEPAHYWRNFKPDGLYHGFDIEPQKGYLYASQANTTLNMSGTLQPSNEPLTISGLSHDASVLNGFNLVGNPFACNATIDQSFYVIEGRNVVPNPGSTIIPPCTGVMVKATDSGQSVTFTKTTALQSTQSSQLQIMLSQAVSTRSMALLDNAIVSFNESDKLEKFHFGNDAKVYIPQGGKDYAIASVSAGRDGVHTVSTTEVPVNFKANENGTYTITVNPEGVNLAYLHLIDNMTGMDVNLLQTPYYTFTAKTNDYESRFKLVFATDDEDGTLTDTGTFAFNSNGNWIISNEGEAILQLIDINGRILSSETISGSVSKAIDVAPGVYILKLNDKVQKIVIR